MTILGWGRRLLLLVEVDGRVGNGVPPVGFYVATFA